jgi:surface antigen
MLFVDRRHKLPTEEQEQSTPSLQPSVNAAQGFSEEQVGFSSSSMWSGEAMSQVQPQASTSSASPAGAQTPISSSSFGMVGPLVNTTLSPNVTGQLAEPPNVTGQLVAPQTGNFPTMTIAPVISRGETTTSLRQPTVIRGSGKTRQLHQSRHLSKNGRIILAISAVCLCVLLTTTALAAVVPVDTQGHAQGLGKILEPLMNVVTSKSNNGSSISIQEAEATAATTDGYNPADIYVGPISPTGSTLGRFFYGQCTYWADYRYHQLTGIWIPWLGNAYEWYQQAINYGWHTSDYPNPNGPSIIVLGPYVQEDLSPYGHVGVVEKINGDGTVTTSNMHWPYVGVVSYVNFKYPVAGTHFIWAP